MHTINTLLYCIFYDIIGASLGQHRTKKAIYRVCVYIERINDAISKYKHIQIHILYYYLPIMIRLSLCFM